MQRQGGEVVRRNCPVGNIRWGARFTESALRYDDADRDEGDSRESTVIGAVLSTILLGLTLYFREAMLGEQAQKHSVVGSKLWGVREALLSLLVDMHDGRAIEDVRRERDRLNQLLEEIYKGAPRTDSKAYGAAQQALKADQELIFTDSELDHMLPQRLRSQRK